MKINISILLLAALPLALASCGQKEEKHAAPAKTVYQTMKLQPGHIGRTVQLPGVMQPFLFVQIFPKVSGFVRNVYVDRGSMVKQGQLLLAMEAPEIQQNVAAAKLRFTQAEADYETSRDRYRRLKEASNTPGAVSTFDLEAAGSKMRADSALTQGEYASYQAQEAMKQYLSITAPFDGVITERNVHPGAIAGPGTQDAKPMLVLHQLSKLRLTADVPEQFAEQMNDGDTVHYRVNALPGQEFTGVISRSSQSLSSNYRAEAIEIDVPNPQGVFKPGMYAEVSLPAGGNTHAFVVPRSAVVTTTEKRYVITVHNGTAQWVTVNEGNQNDDSIEVFGDLHSGDEVVANGSYEVQNGMAINTK